MVSAGKSLWRGGPEQAEYDLVDLVFGSYSRRRPLARPIQATADHTMVRVENGDRNLGILGTNLLQDVQSVHPRHIVIATGAVEIIPIAISSCSPSRIVDLRATCEGTSSPWRIQ